MPDAVTNHKQQYQTSDGQLVAYASYACKTNIFIKWESRTDDASV